MEWWRVLGRLKSLICMLPEIYLVAHTVITCGVCFVKARNKNKNMNCLLRSSASTDSHSSKHSHFCWTDYVFLEDDVYFIFLCFTSFDSFIWTSTLVVPVSPVTGLSLVLIILFLVWKLLLFSVNCNHISYSTELKRRRRKWSESYQLVISVNSHLVRLMDNGESSFLTKTEGMSNFLSSSWKFYGRSLELAVNVRRSSLEAELTTGEGFMKHEVWLCLAISISHFSSLAGVELPT